MSWRRFRDPLTRCCFGREGPTNRLPPFFPTSPNFGRQRRWPKIAKHASTTKRANRIDTQNSPRNDCCLLGRPRPKRRLRRQRLNHRLLRKWAVFPPQTHRRTTKPTNRRVPHLASDLSLPSTHLFLGSPTDDQCEKCCLWCFHFAFPEILIQSLSQ